MSMLPKIINRIYNLLIQNRVYNQIYPHNIIKCRYKISKYVETICFKTFVQIMIMILQINITFSINSINNSCIIKKFTIKTLIFKILMIKIVKIFIIKMILNSRYCLQNRNKISF